MYLYVYRVLRILKRWLKNIIDLPRKVIQFRNFCRLYGFEGVKFSVNQHRGKYQYPSNPLPEFDDNIPIFVVSYNRLDCLKKLLDFLKERDLINNVVIIDNNSTFPPLIEYLHSVQCKVLFLNKNFGHLVLWKCHMFDDVILRQPFVLSDCDVVPEEGIPTDFLRRMYNCLRCHDNLTKVGLSLSLDDIPDSYSRKQEVLSWESKYWTSRLENAPYAFDAPVDTTFAVYRPNVPPYAYEWWKSARLDKPYSARHLGWYIDSDNPTDEDIWYSNTIDDRSTAWFGNDYFKKTNVR